jgi:hypothetical protein
MEIGDVTFPSLYPSSPQNTPTSQNTKIFLKPAKFIPILPGLTASDLDLLRLYS